MFKKIFDFFKQFLDITTLKYAIVGVINTIFGYAVMFGCYNLLHLNYWISSACNYILGTILSYQLNKRFTFKDSKSDSKTPLKFVLCIVLSYLIGYGIAKPLTAAILKTLTKEATENIAMFVGSVFYVGLNYLGQRLFTFSEKK